MTRADDLDQALDAHAAFDQSAAGYRLATLTVDAVVTPTAEAVTIRVVVPSLEVTVKNEVVPAVVVAEWFETFKRRLEAGYEVARRPAASPVEVDRGGNEVTVTYRIEPGDPAVTVADAKAIAEFVQGTYVQGAIPGYDYGPPLGDLLSGAWDAGST